MDVTAHCGCHLTEMHAQSAVWTSVVLCEHHAEHAEPGKRAVGTWSGEWREWSDNSEESDE